MGIRRRQHALGTTAVSFRHAPRPSSPLGDHIVAFPARRCLFERVLHGDLSIAQILIVHTFNGQIGRLKGIERNESKPLALIGHVVPHNFGWFDDSTECREGIIKKLLVNIPRIQIANEQIRSHIQRPRPGAFVQTALRDAHRPPEQFDHAHDLNGVIGIGDVEELDEAISGVEASELVFGHVDRVDPSYLREEFDEEVFGRGGVEVADVACGFLVAVFDVGEGCHDCYN
mmetsp:Transcript_24542/g.52054  ORF Transcript_24542/g.52054 Transcript_24542/m.52054 type:complete len:230 (+) Transcript_24542:394-1083(+)